jgi:hypothetical protein
MAEGGTNYLVDAREGGREGGREREREGEREGGKEGGRKRLTAHSSVSNLGLIEHKVALAIQLLVRVQHLAL